MSLKLDSKRHIYILVILAISSFTHLWNASGFPDVFFDEGAYLHRAMHVLDGLGPEEGAYYDHPFFGQIFLASIFTIIGYPYSMHFTSNINSISIIYLIPRILMGILSVIDTFLVYKIADKQYGKNAAIVSSVLFSVMPITWIFRRVLLDTILLPFLLLSILAALHSKNSKRNTWLVLLSGVCLGLAIFTKIPAFTLIPLVGSLVFWHNKKSLKMLALWILPVIIIPFAWPIQSIESGHFDNWTHDVFYLQTHRTGGSDLFAITKSFIQMDPVLFWFAVAGTVFATIKRDYFITTWLVPFVIFLYLIGYNQYFYWIPIIPVLCIAAGVLVTKLAEKIPRKKIAHICILGVILGVGIFGVVNLFQVISTNMTSAQYETISFVLNDTKDTENASIFTGPANSWVLDNIFHKRYVLIHYYLLSWPVYTKKVVLVADPHYFIDFGLGKQLGQMYNSTHTVIAFDGQISKYDTSQYPYQNLYYTTEGKRIEIRTR